MEKKILKQTSKKVKTISMSKRINRIKTSSKTKPNRKCRLSLTLTEAIFYSNLLKKFRRNNRKKSRLNMRIKSRRNWMKIKSKLKIQRSTLMNLRNLHLKTPITQMTAKQWNTNLTRMQSNSKVNWRPRTQRKCLTLIKRTRLDSMRTSRNKIKKSKI